MTGLPAPGRFLLMRLLWCLVRRNPEITAVWAGVVLINVAVRLPHLVILPLGSVGVALLWVGLWLVHRRYLSYRPRHRA